MSPCLLLMTKKHSRESTPNNHEHDHQLDQDFDGLSLDALEENFQSLASELKEAKDHNIANLLNTKNDEEAERTPYFRNYNPSIIDYLERATTELECKEIIEYCLQKSEITQQEADVFFDRLRRGGSRAFGSRKAGYYNKKL